MADSRGVVRVHRIGAGVVALAITVIGVLGLIGSLGFFATSGTPVLGLSTNGALSTVSLVTAIVLAAAAVRGGRTASTVMIVVGVLFLVSAFTNLWLIGTAANVLAFRLPNVFFSIGAGMVLLFLGAYGRLSGRPPSDNPYHPQTKTDEVGNEPAGPVRSGPADVEADTAMAEAERAEVSGTASPDQHRRLEAADEQRSQEERRRVWQSFDRHSERS